MQTSGLPSRVGVPFANSGTKNTIPVASQIGITGGAASFTDGFPPLTMTPVSAGGIPPFGADFNGILNAITVALRWNAAGASYPFDSAFSATVSGYPKGAVIPASDYSCYWLNTQEANTTNPENSTSAITGWVPYSAYGTTAITGLSSSSITLTTLQAAKNTITLAGTLTAIISITLPAWTKEWRVINNCSGGFTVTIKTLAGSGVNVAPGNCTLLRGDGTNIVDANNSLNINGSPITTTQSTGDSSNKIATTAFVNNSILANTGRLINTQMFSASGTYTPTTGTKKIRVKLVGGGGGGGGAVANTISGNISVGFGGSSGSYGETGLIDATSITTVTVTVGGAGTTNVGVAGSAGGTTSFGAYLIAPGGSGGTVGATNSYTAPILGSDLALTGACSGSAVNISIQGDGGKSGFILGNTQGNQIKGGSGGSSMIGNGATGSTSGVVPSVGTGFGSGGAGAAASNVSGTSGVRGSYGNAGLVIVEEYA